MSVKNAIYQVDNGSGFDEIHFKTKAAQVVCNDGKTVEETLLQKGAKNTALKNLKAGWSIDTDTGIITQWMIINALINPKGVDERNLTLPMLFTTEIIGMSAICSYNSGLGNANFLEYINFGARVRTLNSLDLYSRDVVGMPTANTFEIRLEVKGW